MPLPLRFLFSVLLLAPAAGCTNADVLTKDEVVWSESALRDHLRQLADSVVPMDSAQTAQRALYAVRQMRTAGLMPAREPSFLLRMGGTDVPVSPETFVGPTQAHVLGYVAGRHPSHSDGLVLIAADLNSSGAAAVLEAARALAQEARYTQTPERTVLFALWAPPRTGARGLSDFLANPTWSLRNVHRVLLVTADSAAVAENWRLLAAHDIPADVLAVDDQSVAVEGAQPEIERARTLARTVRLTDALYARTRTVVAASDSTIASLQPHLAP